MLATRYVAAPGGFGGHLVIAFAGSLVEIAPLVRVCDVVANTEAELAVPEDVPRMNF
jgi:hypothetical protein